MLRGHFKSFAIYSLITSLLASPVVAASPGDASRRAASRAHSSRQTAPANSQNNSHSAVQNALGLQPIGQRAPIQQVVGKQPSAPKTDPNRTLSLFPGLFGGSQRPSTTRSGTPSPAQTPRTYSSGAGENAIAGKGILTELFGSQDNHQPRPAAQPVASQPSSVNWQGIPYHQARSKPTPQTQTPIRDPRPGETRLGQSTIPTAPPTTNVATPSVPQPPALAPAPTSRRTTPTRVVSSRIEHSEPANLSPLSSSRRPGRRDVPALDASEIAAAKDLPASDSGLVPSVTRREINPEPAATVTAEKAAKPSATTTAATPSTNALPPKDNQPKSTPSAEVAVNPQPKTTTGMTTTDVPDQDVALQESSNAAPETSSNNVANSETAAAAPADVAVNSQPTHSGPAAASLMPLETSTGPIPVDPPAPKPADAITASTVAANTLAPAPQLPPTDLDQPQPIEPQFVAPRLPLPSSPQFGPTGAVAGHRSGPPTSAFQPRVQPRAALNPATVPFGPAAGPIGSGVSPQPAASEYPTTPDAAQFAQQTRLPQQTALPPHSVLAPQMPAPTYNGGNAFTQTQRIAQNPYPYSRDPYAVPQTAASNGVIPYGGQYAEQYSGQYAGQTQPTPSPATAPTIAPSITSPRSGLGAPTESAETTYSAATPQSLSQTPALPPTADQTSIASDTYTNGHGAGAPFIDHPFESPQQPRPAINRSASELPAGQTAVASELPGIRVITHGPSSVTIRQTHEFEIRVENRGSIDASGLMVRTVVPDWAEVKGQTSSRGSVENQELDDSNRLVWSIDSLPAGTTEKMFVRLQARQSGMHKLDVDWTLIPQKSVAKIEVREPKLDLVIEGPEEVVYGESQTYKVRVLNPGDGIAANVVFTLSPNSSTPQTQRIGDIPSGKEAQFEVELTAQDLGDLKIHGLAAGDLGLKAQAEKTILVSSADLEAVLAGPEMQYQNTDAMYHLQITNKGTATCKNIVANLALPPGVRYQGGIDIAKKHGTKLSWEIESLPPGSSRDYELNCTMVSPGKQTFDFDAMGSAAGKATVALSTNVESIADLVMTIQDPAAPAPVGTEVVYEILIKNRGSRQAQGVRAIAQFSEGIEPRRIEGHTGQVLTGQVLFDPIETIRPGEEIRIRVIAEAETEGHHRFRTEIRSGETVLVAEEATQYLSKRGERVSRRSSSSAR
ncbi:MAG: hypothetical protein KDB00_11725 [Planctomycetales bacterium]|nr:hypothetical protein [Planctomycetales bacterium]